MGPDVDLSALADQGGGQDGGVFFSLQKGGQGREEVVWGWGGVGMEGGRDGHEPRGKTQRFHIKRSVRPAFFFKDTSSC